MEDSLNLKAPTDEKLLTTFHDHRETFEKLWQMVIEDRQQYGAIFSESILKKSTIAESRRQEYIKLLSESHPGLVVTRDWNNVVRFIFASGSLAAIRAD